MYCVLYYLPDVTVYTDQDVMKGNHKPYIHVVCHYLLCIILSAWCNSIQLFHACSGNSQNYWPEVLEMTWELSLCIVYYIIWLV